MDYEKKYEAALEIARHYHDEMEGDICCVLEECFPELKESEDEKIKKEIINYFRCQSRDEPSRKDIHNKWIAWLEKQGGKDKLIRELGEYKVKYTQEVLEKRIDNMNNKDDEKLRNTTIAFLKDFADKGYENAIECIDWLKKQGEQKFADEVEPKYMCHSWTIEDAKNGDVLCSGQLIILFKQWEANADCNFAIAHAGIDISGKLQITNGHWFISNETKPATKEQRELLFQKIKEADYEWDANKKELKKIDARKNLTLDGDLMQADCMIVE